MPRPRKPKAKNLSAASVLKLQRELAKCRLEHGQKAPPVSPAAQRGTGLLSSMKKKAALSGRLKQEPQPIENYVKRAMQAGQSAKKALDQGRILYNAGRLGPDGRLVSTTPKKKFGLFGRR
jgi:hypothetical protein